MGSRVRFAGAALAVVCALTLAVPVAASAARSNAECAVCHGAGSFMENAVFEVGAVDKATACRACHLDSLANVHPNHYGGGNCGGACHTGWGGSLAARVPTVLTPAGAFAGVNSPNTSSGILHAIHATPRWVHGLDYDFSRCGSCHATAACTACHNGTPAVDATHALHGDAPTSTPISPWTGDVSPGVTGSQADDTKMSDAEVRCGASGCHDIDGRAEGAPVYMDCYEHAEFADRRYVSSVGAVTKVGTWQNLVSTLCSLQREIHSNSPAASVTIRFTGQRVTIFGTADAYRGIGEVLIDGVSRGTFDQFRATTKRQVPVWTSGVLAPGEHTVTIRPTGTRNPLSRSTWVSFDHLSIETTVADGSVPQCVSCHPGQGLDSHYGSGGPGFSHEVTQTISATNLWNTGYGTYSCDACHVAPLITEHRRPTSSGVTATSSCVICHTAYASATWSGTYPLASGCEFGECHSLASGRQRHALTVAKHEIAPAGQSVACTGCHGVDMRAAHANSVPGNGFVETNGCLACHSTSSLASATTCTEAGCHPNTTNAMADHPIASASSHVASEAGKPFTRAYQTVAGLDDGGRECAECHSEHLFFAHSDTPAVSCASGGAGGVGCHLDTRLGSVATASSGWTSRKCTDCHEYGPARTHDSTATAHLTSSNGCAGSGTYCHSSNDLWQIHLRAQNGGPAEGESCANTGCHDTRDRRPSVNLTNSCGSTSTGCHTSYTITHATNFQHAFSAASYYSVASNTGCTNRTGCHNAGVASTADFGAVHHADTGCFEGACHQSSSKPAFSGLLPTDCQECHTASAFAGAPARANLAASPAAGGHYSETTHTAGGMTAAVSAGGTASATCSQCHSPAIGGTGNGLANQHTSISVAGSPYGSALACGECHADTRTFGYAQVDADWPARTCAACHLPGGSSPLDHAATAPAVNESGSTCGGSGASCHPSPDLHQIHKNAPSGCNLTGCHVYSQQAGRPAIRSCGPGSGGCHLTDPHDPAAHTTLSSGACVVCHESADLKVVHADQCSFCHANPTYPALPTGKLECVSCHVAGVVGAKSYSPVDPAHYAGAEAAHTAGAQTGTVSGFGCTQCHRMEMKPEHITKTSSAFSTVPGTYADKCIACHEGPVDGFGATPWNDTCDACHATKHSGMAARHNGSAVGAGCTGSQTNTITLESMGFETGGTWPATWTRAGDTTYLRLGTTSPYAGTYTGEVWANSTTRRTVTFAKTFNTTGLTNPTLEFYYTTIQLESPDYAQVQVSTNGSTYTDLMPQTFANVGWTKRTYALPVGATVTVRFHGSVNATTEFVRYDNILITGTQTVQTCHAVGDVAALHEGSASRCAACHTTNTTVPSTLDCSTPACHGSGANHDSMHTVTGASMATTLTVGTGGTTSATCAECHSSLLRLAHEHAPGYATASLGWTDECTNCHGATSPIVVANLIAAGNWTQTCTGNGCHNVGQAAHVSGGTSVPAVTGINTTTTACTKSGCHATLEIHALHADAPDGCDLEDPNGACHTAGNIDRRPTQKTCGDTGGCHEGIQANGGHGVSQGGRPCDECHVSLLGMVSDTSTYHHVLDAADPFQAPAMGSYPTSRDTLSCVSCHVDHDQYSPLPGGTGKAFSIRDSALTASPVGTDTDQGLCLSCHSVDLVRNATGQRSNIITETRVWSIDATWWAGSPHNYDSPGQFNDGSTFRANCAKCHGTLEGTLSSGKFATHFSSEQRLLNALGDSVTPNVNEEQMCFRCHSKASDPLAGVKKPSDLVDWYGTQPMSLSNVSIYSQMTAGANTYGHKPHLYANKHLLSEHDETQAYISATKHVECADCHNHHVVGDARHEWGTTNLVSEAIRGVTGQGFATAALSSVNFPSTAQVNAQLSWKTYSTYEYEICFKCHSSANTNLAAWGGTKSGATTQNRWTNLAADFNVGNQSRHPVLAPLDAFPDTTTYGTSKVFAGQLIDIWAPGDTMYCSDCHGNQNAPLPSDPDNVNHTQGPHGSSVEYSLRGPNTAWPINPRTGQIFTLNDVYGGDRPFCMNCHPSVGANKVHARAQAHKNARCTNCHILIPHGGGMSRLLGDGDGAMPARYAYNNDKNTMWIASFNKRSDPNTYMRGDCWVTAAGSSACSTGHSVGSNAGQENW